MIVERTHPHLNYARRSRVRPRILVDLLCGIPAVVIIFPAAVFLLYHAGRMVSRDLRLSLLMFAFALAGFGFGTWLVIGALRAWRNRHVIDEPARVRKPSRHWRWITPCVFITFGTDCLLVPSATPISRLFWTAVVLLHATALLQEVRSRIRGRLESRQKR